MIYKLPDGTRVRVVPDENGAEFETYKFTPTKETLGVERLSGEAMERRIAELTALDAIRFGQQFSAGRQIDRQPAQHTVAELREALTKGHAMTPTQTILVPALKIRAGDVFERHGRERVATSDAQRYGQFSVVIEFDNGNGCVWISIDAEVTVTREVRRRTSWSATA
ncbi:hypothetical protein ACFUGD_01140 [Streptomyces sp. NPDC057217]|uniref:hypothetical protein n=1 Tax=Streptomyces sp. NPDC057217 TaxID=3346054 RepID=UPI003638B467